MIEMHEHDFDLIAAFAEGTASPEEVAAADRALADCPECTSEYEAQLEVLEVLRSAAPVAMTDLERAALHRGLKPAAPAPRIGWFSRYAPRVAAVAAGFAVIGLASVAMLDLGSDTTDTAVFDTPAANTQEAPQDGGADAPTEAASVDESRRLAESALDDSDLELGVADEAAGATPLPDQNILEITAADLDGFAQSLGGESDARFFGLAEETAARCAEHLPSPLQVDLAAEVLFEEQPAVVIVYVVDGETVSAALSLDDCEVLAEYVSSP